LKSILIIHGANLNKLGEREPSKYGNMTSDELFNQLKNNNPSINLHYFQSNSESEIIHKIHNCDTQYDGVIINAGAYSHTSIAIADAIKSVKCPFISVHITNIFNRESYRHVDLIGEACMGSIVGMGTDGYQLALETITEE
jgi:3-dehydroquinate dehydratase-2